DISFTYELTGASLRSELIEMYCTIVPSNVMRCRYELATSLYFGPKACPILQDKRVTPSLIDANATTQPYNQELAISRIGQVANWVVAIDVHPAYPVFEASALAIENVNAASGFPAQSCHSPRGDVLAVGRNSHGLQSPLFPIGDWWPQDSE